MISSVRNAEVMRPPTIGAAIRFMTSAPVPSLQRSGTRPEHHRGHGHELRPHALNSSLHVRPDDVLEIANLASAEPPLEGRVEALWCRPWIPARRGHTSGGGHHPRDTRHTTHGAALHDLLA